ncbi:polysaccharide biosynthesis protein [Pseudodesulfovibrio piezophilus]|uniref:Polysaccharide biosynthesis protein CapD n=1 Tax=Pseudodesulfovibrio piezophilus (strain DSM 21447 / JCM 15486 / C1TLV30) TaxID=1322246 RepID=M1WR99_PSEP2|nr:nucleoside-diphosphate sugar epimerase/dehydratase [Pseudodesulfovibrio piezophilus]CCH49404.1 Polysaccharide biosynthesis protein CapD [Pseudodesulfovibrio piezophilus C1TLV30]
MKLKPSLPNFRNANFYVMFLADLVIFTLALFMAYSFRFDFDIPPDFFHQFTGLLKYVLIFKSVVFVTFGLYRGMWRYTSLDDYWKMLRVTTLQNLLLISFVVLRFSFAGVPRSIFVIDWILTLVLCSGVRLSIRAFYAQAESMTAPSAERKTILVVGTGSLAEKIGRELVGNPAQYTLVGFLDEDPGKRGRTIHGKPVLGNIALMKTLVERDEVDEIFIAVSRASGEEMRLIAEACKTTGVPFKILPAMTEIMDGKVGIKALRDVDYLDLLGRSPVTLDTDRILAYLSGQTVLVTGCGGSIGSELCRQIVRFKPSHIVLVDSSEYNLYQMQMELHHGLGFTGYTTVLGSITDTDLMTRTFAAHTPSTVFHAAAYKHVPMLERNPWQAVRNNILGSQTIMHAAVESGVERFVVVSTDKAVRPTNVMGASKRVTELLMQSLHGRGTRFMAVRFGNVVGSSGSVVPLFRRQIETGGPVTVTHPDVTRYFMSISEASQLILQAGSMGETGTGGEIFVLDMGVPVKIADMARDLIRLSGKKPDVDIQIIFTGLREGEKLFEELITEGEGIVRTEHEKILVLGTDCCADQQTLSKEVDALVKASEDYDGTAIRSLLMRLVPEYTPSDN